MFMGPHEKKKQRHKNSTKSYPNKQLNLLSYFTGLSRELKIAYKFENWLKPAEYGGLLRFLLQKK